MTLNAQAINAAARVHDHWKGDATVGGLNALRNTREIVGAYIEATRDMVAPLTYPRELSDDLRHVLSMMMWNTGPIAHCLRSGGAEIPHKAEAEQAYVLHWLTLLVLEHGSAWREKAQVYLAEIHASLEKAGGGDA